MDQRPQFSCQFNGCGKAFMRKGHLTRHEKTHSGPSFNCEVCQRQFSRRDTLQRHLGSHGNAFKDPPSRRSRRACERCRAGKSKCDGGDSCAACVKRNLPCTYQRSMQSPAESTIDHQLAISSASRKTTSFTTDPKVPISTVHSTVRLVDWAAMRIQKDPATSDEMAPASEEYMRAYFNHFDHHWPIIHRATYMDISEAESVRSIVDAIGAWFVGTTTAKQHAIYVHNSMMKDLRSQLCQVTSQDLFHETLPKDTCVKVLLCVIFALYRGETSVVFEASNLRHLLISALRMVGFFSPNTAWVDERPGYFIPMHLVGLEFRKRLASYLLKADTYLGIVQNQPNVLMAGECHFASPSSYAAWTTGNLLDFEQRQAFESSRQSPDPLSDMIRKANSGNFTTYQDQVLIEDIFLCICGLYSTISQLSFEPTNDNKVVLRKKELQHHLDAMNHRLEQYDSSSIMFRRFYYGSEEDSSPSWESVIHHRIETLLTNAKTLYRLSSLYLLTDIRCLSALAKNLKLTAIERLSIRHGSVRDRNESSAKSWAESPAGRHAMCHVAGIIVEQKSNIQLVTSDPIAHMSVCTAALVTWSFLQFGPSHCDICVQPRPSSPCWIDLTDWGTCQVESQRANQFWIEDGAARVQIKGKVLCRCNIDSWMAIFTDLIPGGWEIADFLAPNLLNRSSA